jgi:hypothetical protein
MMADVTPLATDQPISVPLPEFVRQIAIEAARTVIKDHTEQCPISSVQDDLKTVQGEQSRINVRFAGLVGLMVGSGVCGGGVVALASAIFKG